MVIFQQLTVQPPEGHGAGRVQCERGCRVRGSTHPGSRTRGITQARPSPPSVRTPDFCFLHEEPEAPESQCSLCNPFFMTVDTISEGMKKIHCGSKLDTVNAL